MFLNKKAVEGLPLKYIIVALMAALVVGIVLKMTGTLGGGIQGTAETLNESVSNRVSCELDNENPVINTPTYTLCNNTSHKISMKVKVTDNCGVDSVAFALDGSSNYTSMSLEDGDDDTNGYWSVTNVTVDDFGANLSLAIHAYDKAGESNDGWYDSPSPITCTS